MAGDSLIPVIIHLDGQTRVNTVVLVDENIESFEELATLFYTTLRPKIPEFYLEQGERHITKMWITWNPGNDRFLPTSTDIDEENIRGCLRILGLRRGADMVGVWLNEID
ncbi:hypothetical protein AJ80_09956 [Polytolypa hystricis UAMH7299]|uniref:Uncharacterized protein n=1 Tax=Polytolypa hystricis (strain UAMH7299) TaxID=1447883 RepID=A0A2B7WG68_POLH7|nr:hypothetical protein AJ80_09956 [Polytolypa hystricis UAMH7299]